MWLGIKEIVNIKSKNLNSPNTGWPLFFPTGIPQHFQDFQDIFDHFSRTIWHGNRVFLHNIIVRNEVSPGEKVTNMRNV